ncbi:hypothetical protein D7Y91_07185 [Salmonella enterica subsp. enterica serovar Kumasi]|nr:hypothetical protein [Salmonella enterica subsp. enterica serovar Kumasi]
MVIFFSSYLLTQSLFDLIITQKVIHERIAQAETTTSWLSCIFKYYQNGNGEVCMQWKVINGWYCVTACGLMSWKFRTLGEAMNWVFVSKLAVKTEMDMGVSK